MKALSGMGRSVRIVVLFRLVAALATTLIAVATIVYPEQVVGWYYGWLVLWGAALPSWVVVAAARFWRTDATRLALIHDVFILWAAVVVLPGLPNMMGVVLLWFMVFFIVEGLAIVALIVRRRTC